MGKDEEILSSSQLNVIANGTIIKGDITTNGDIKIDGNLEGTIITKSKVIVGEKGVLKGTINASNIEIMGTVTGDMTAANAMTLKSTANVTGNIRTVTIVIEQNAQFNGNCKMGKEEPQAAPAPAPAANPQNFVKK
ncbi:MAG: polymer-forming cytoskeletal protein [Paludibacteraceae bacterium]|nr:polymer-forming cytoskeletal protein [Paludibacteraceae bacterium]